MLEGVPSEKPMVTFVCDPEFLKKIDTFRWKHRMKSRAAALIWLIQRGLENPGDPPGAEIEDEDSTDA